MNATHAITNAEISRRILAHIAAGKTLQQAIDAVCGAGVFQGLVDDLYDAANDRRDSNAAR